MHMPVVLCRSDSEPESILDILPGQRLVPEITSINTVTQFGGCPLFDTPLRGLSAQIYIDK